MEIVITVAPDGSVRAEWPDDKPFQTLALLQQVHDTLRAQFAQAEASSGPKLLLARGSLNGAHPQAKP